MYIAIYIYIYIHTHTHILIMTHEEHYSLLYINNSLGSIVAMGSVEVVMRGATVVGAVDKE